MRCASCGYALPANRRRAGAPGRALAGGSPLSLFRRDEKGSRTLARMSGGTSGPKLPFERLGDYEVLAPIAEGGMASVWLARSTTGAQSSSR